MLYLAIDQHKNYLTINIRNEQGDVIQKGQVRTSPDDVDEFFVAFVKKARKHRGYMAIVEVCSFNDWLLAKLKKTQCKEIVVVQPNNTAVNKTDKRDTDALGALLWNNRKRLEGGQRPNGITKRGNAIARQTLNFAVNHIVRKDPAMKEWHKKIKKRRGAKTARVAVMRRLATIIWHMLRWGKPYQFRYDPPLAAPKKGDLRSPKEVLGGIDNRNHSRKKEGTPLKCRCKTKA